VIIITAFGSIESAVESMKLGARDFITKPFGNQELLSAVSRVLENRGELARSYGRDNIIAADPKMAALLEMLEQIADKRSDHGRKLNRQGSDRARNSFPESAAHRPLCTNKLRGHSRKPN
jgi:FixJ family two-component response regulator